MATRWVPYFCLLGRAYAAFVRDRSGAVKFIRYFGWCLENANLHFLQLLFIYIFFNFWKIDTLFSCDFFSQFCITLKFKLSQRDPIGDLWIENPVQGSIDPHRQSFKPTLG